MSENLIDRLRQADGLLTNRHTSDSLFAEAINEIERVAALYSTLLNTIAKVEGGAPDE